ncbi:axin-1-like, partial [Carassius auratus]|uniref:Axin-1 n=1 Tax=Carassius auratus TaxID=7957 RepID=A0A6P6NYI6_CARAU
YIAKDCELKSYACPYRDGVPPYRYRKPHRHEIHESAKVNGRVPLPHIPRTNRMPKDIHVEPEKFAAELISRLEGVLREREAQEKLEERLKRVRLEEEGDDADISTAPSLANHRIPPAVHVQHYGGRYSEMSYNGLQLRDAHEENPESILDEHVQRVMKTPGCQSPGTGRHSPKSRSPDGLPAGKIPGMMMMPLSGGQGKHQARLGPKGEAAHLHHHKHIHHTHYAAGGKPKEQVDAEAMRMHGGLAWNMEQHHFGSKSRNFADGMSVGPSAMDPMGYGSKGSTLSKRPVRKGEDGRNFEMREPLPLDDMERNQKILQWMMEGEKEAGRSKRSPYGSISGSKKAQSHEVSRPSSVERPGAVHPWVTAQLRNNVQPSHPFIQDPTMPPNPAPNPLTQLEEARRRLEEERRKSGALQAKPRHKNMKKQPCENITVAYYFCGEPIPYRTTVKGRIVTLGQFKELLTKKGSYRYYFKKVSDEFDCGVVFEEVREDDAILPIFEEKIIGKVEKID